MTSAGIEPHRAYEHLVVPFDGSAAAEQAATAAAQLAAVSGAALHVLYVQDDAGRSGDAVAAQARLLAGRLGTRAEIRPAADKSVPPGTAIGAYLQELGNATAVMSTHGRGRLGSAVLGSVMADVVAAGHAVVALGPRASLEEPPKRVLACVDPTGLAADVVAEAAGWARALQVPLWLIEVVSPKVLVPSHEGRESAFVHGLADQARADGLTLEWEVLHHDRPDEAIVTYATVPGTMLALATHGRTGVQRALVGSVTGDVLRSATCPVVLVRPVS